MLFFQQPPPTINQEFWEQELQVREIVKKLQKSNVKNVKC